MFISPPTGARFVSGRLNWMERLDATISMEDALLYAGIILLAWFIWGVVKSLKRLR